jgi:hypothetical protein
MSTLQSLPTAPPRARRTVLPIAALLALVVGAAGVLLITAGDDSDPARTEFRLPSHVTTHGGAPVPEVSSAARPSGVRIDILPPMAAPFPQDLRSPDARDASAPSPPAQDLRSPDARDAGH